MNFEGKVALIAGGAGGLGRIVVRHLASLGASIAVPLHSEADRASLPGGSSARIFSEVCDIADEKSAARFVDEVEKRFGSIDILINLAGGFAGGKLIEDVPTQEWREMLDGNLTTAFLMCRSVLPVLRKKNAGRIISIAAMPALTSGAKRGPYAIAKRGVITLTETIADEVRGTGITANAIAPSIILTAANKNSMPDADSSRWVTPEEIAALIAFLCSDEARSISGNVIRIYGRV